MKRPYSINNVEVNDDVIILQSYTYDRKTFYVNKETFKIHNSIPMTNDNEVDEENRLHIIDAMTTHYTQKKLDADTILNLIVALKN